MCCRDAELCPVLLSLGKNPFPLGAGALAKQRKRKLPPPPPHPVLQQHELTAAGAGKRLYFSKDMTHAGSNPESPAFSHRTGPLLGTGICGAVREAGGGRRRDRALSPLFAERPRREHESPISKAPQKRPLPEPRSI